MGRRRNTGALGAIAAMPWPFGLVLGIIGFLLIRHFGGAMFAPFGWLALAACWMAALVSFFGAQQRRRLLETQTGLDSLRAMSWREFEMLVGEAFRRQGYAIEETGLGGADGGIDLLLRKDGRTELVQCKQWRTRQVKVSTVREMWGLASHHRAAGVKIVCVGEYTADAEAFAAGKSIELICGDALLALVRSVQRESQPAQRVGPRTTAVTNPAVAGPTAPDCPLCSEAMQLRTNRQSGLQFWGCGNYPKCKGTRSA